MRLGARPGLKALITSSKCEPTTLDESDVSFRLAPRINAAGRLYRADAGVELHDGMDVQREASVAGLEKRLASGKAHVHDKENDSGPTVETVKQGDKIVRLIVTCSCGERIEIDCLYPAGG